MERWMELVRAALERLTDGEVFHEDDLPDWGYAAAFEAGVKPEVAARRALRAGGLF